jgi:integrase
MEIYKQEGSKYWIADFRVNGRRIRKSTKQTKRSAAQEAAMLMLREAKSDPVPAPVQSKAIPTIEQFAKETFLPFLDACTLDPDTIYCYRNGWRLLKNTEYAHTPLDQVCFSDVDMLTVPGGPSNTNNMRRTLRRMLSLAFDKKVLAACPRIRLVREKKRTAVYSPAMEKKVLEMAEQPLLDIFLLVFDSGARPDESVHLQWPDMMWDKHLIHIRWGKTPLSERHVPMSDRVKQMLIGRLKASKSRWVFPSTRKKDAPMGYTPIKRRFKKLLVSRLTLCSTADAIRSLRTCWTAQGISSSWPIPSGTPASRRPHATYTPQRRGWPSTSTAETWRVRRKEKQHPWNLVILWAYQHRLAVTIYAKLLILWCAQRDSNSRPIDS